MLSKLQRKNKTFAESRQEIANMLNDYFVNVGPKLAEKIPQLQKSFESFLTDSSADCFRIHHTNSEECLKVITSFSSSNCEDPAKISPGEYKLGTSALSNILPNLVNKCFDQGYFPDCLKLARVTPIFRRVIVHFVVIGGPYQ